MSHSIEDISLTRLRFDPRNPRLVSDDDEELSESECAERLFDNFDPLPIGRSIASFGFFPTDPLVGRVRDDGTVVIHEGNRRLLAVRLLLDESLRAELNVPTEWHELSESASADIKASLSKLPVYVVDTWEEAVPIIGVRHIVGIETWKAFEKAAFVRDLLAHSGSTDPFQWASDVTGEPVSRIRRYVRDDLVLSQAERAGVDVQSARERFGNFTRLMSTEGIIEYLDLIPARDITPSSTEAFLAPAENLASVFSYAFGSEMDDPVLTDHRKYKELGTVMASEEARAHLSTTRDLEASLALTSGIRDRVFSHLTKALNAIAMASSDLVHLENDEGIDELIEEIRSALHLLSEHRPVPGRPVDSDDIEDFDLDIVDEDEGDA